MRRYLNEVKKSWKFFIKHKDFEHLKDMWRLTKYYASNRGDKRGK